MRYKCSLPNCSYCCKPGLSRRAKRAIGAILLIEAILVAVLWRVIGA